MKKKLFSLALALALCLGLTVPAFARDGALVGCPAPIGTGNVHAYIDTNHSLWTFGKNWSGELGNGSHIPGISSPPDLIPTKVLDNVYSVSVGQNSTYAIKQDGSLWVWGYNGSGDLGFEGGNAYQDNGYSLIQTVPYKLMDDVAAVCHDDCSVVIKKDGSLWGWGWTLTGDDDYKMKKLANNVIAVSVDTGRVAYVTSDHALWIKESTDPSKQVMSDVIDTAIGYNFVFAIKSDHSLWAWGKNEKGQLGIGSTEPSDTPVKVMDGVRQVSIGDRNIAAVKLDNSLWVWGDNYEYRLGTTHTDLKSTGMVNPYRIIWTPVKIMDDVAYVNVQNLTFVKTDGSYWNNYLQTNGKPVQLPNIVVTLDSLQIGSSTTPITPGSSSTDKPTSGTTITISSTGETITIPSTGTNPSEQTPIISNSSSAFSDVKSTDYYADAVQWAVEKNITSGTSATTFSPNSTCTNAQILAFLYRVSGSPESTVSNPFADVKATDYYYKAALWAAQKGMVSGSTFGANTPCTRAATVEYMWKAAGSPAASYDGKFDDVPASADYAQAVAWALENGVTSGTSKTTFGPDSTCTRGQIVTFLYRAFGK